MSRCGRPRNINFQRGGTTLLLIGFAASLVRCSSDAAELAREAPDGAAPAVQHPQATVTDAPDAVALLASLRHRFRHTIHAGPLGFDPSLHDPDVKPVTQPVIGGGFADGFERHTDGAIRPNIPDSHKKAVGRPAGVRHPATADGTMWLQDESTGMSIRFSLRDAHPVAPQAASGLLLYRGALGGGDVIHRPTPVGLEDYIVVNAPADGASISYRIDVSGVPGLRLVPEALEFLDDKGAPRLRVPRPFVVDSSGRRIDASMRLSGCDYDADLRHSYERPITPPGADACTLTITWNADEAGYPVIVDPDWQTTGFMITPRYGHTLDSISSARAIAAGGRSSAGGVLRSTEIYYGDAGGIWGASSLMAHLRYRHASARVTRRDMNGCFGECIFVTGGLSTVSPVNPTTAIDTVEYFDISERVWHVDSPMSQPRAGHAMFTYLGGLPVTSSIRVVGGCSGSNPNVDGAGPGVNTIEDYLGPSSTWGMSMSTIGTGRCDFASWNTGSSVGIAGGRYAPTTTVYYVSTIAGSSKSFSGFGSWKTFGSLATARAFSSAAEYNNNVAIAGGRNASSYYADSRVFVYDPATAAMTLKASPGFTTGRYSATLTARGSRLLLAGGYTDNAGGATDTAYTMDPAASQPEWTAVEPIPVLKRGEHAATVLSYGVNQQKILIAGGYDNPKATESSVLFGYESGWACALNDDCRSGFCVDGVCCSTACTGTCKACSASKKGQGADGICDNIVSNHDPDGECLSMGQATCGSTGVCNGAGACKFWAAGSACEDKHCVGNTLTWRECDGAGACLLKESACGAYQCQAAPVCPSSCSSESQCSSAYFCENSLCHAKRAAGQTCVADKQCTSGFCVDGFCCTTACNDPCMACAASLKESGLGSGTCGVAKTGSDPHEDCPEDGTSGCDRDGMCNGAGACRLYSSSTPCGATVCDGNTVKGMLCNGTGDCQMSTSGTACSPYLCAEGVCAGSCASDSQCVSGHYCNSSGQCAARLATGTACTAANHCATGHCVDGYCCDTACNNLCEACAADKKTSGVGHGTCGPAKAGLDPHGDCADDGAASCGKDGWCNGAGACRQYSSSTSCGATVCDGNVVKGQLCNGAGTCQFSNSGTDCAPYFCKSGACPNSCTADAECASGYYCDSAHHCTARQANGTVCTSASQCTSANCVDGYCCDTACTDQCQACAATLKQSATGNGVCGAAKAGHDPHEDCADDGAGSCQRDGTCNGSGGCRLYSASTSCGSTVCDGNTVKGMLCTGTGVCQMSSGGTGCSPYLCQGGICAATCAADAQCESGYYCDAAHHCTARQGNGTVCATATQCNSGNCVDGYCCDTACTDLCQACAATLKESATGDGVCGAAKTGTDPHNECPDEGASSCQRNGLCNGAGACKIYDSSTSCGQSYCDGNAKKDRRCDGTGQCVSSSGQECGSFACLPGGVCAASCSYATDCAPGFWCDAATSKCQDKLAVGQACAAGAQCASGFCADGVCCNQACTGTCRACSAQKKGTGADGDCGNIGAGSDPDDECAVDPNNLCGSDGFCGGNGSCRMKVAGFACGATQCTSNVVSGQICNGLGACVADAAGTSCAPYLCAVDKCAASCVSDTQCVSEAFCNPAGQCTAKKAKAEACTSDKECASGFCVDGVCCLTSCKSTCQACSPSAKQDGSIAASGECGPAKAGMDPHDDCDLQDAKTCLQDGTCDGSGACRLYPAGQACGATACVGNEVTGQLCDGLGTCIADQNGVSCAPYLCQESICSKTCVSDSQCTSGAYCTAQGACELKSDAGQACAQGSACHSGFCVDGVCCDKPCTGQCEACDMTGLKGICSPASGAPHGQRSACAGQDTPCEGTCDGVATAACVYPGVAVVCATSCAGGAETTSVCSGDGKCVVGPTAPCAPFACDPGKGCKAACASASDCASGFECQGNKCVPTQGGTCDNDHTIVAADGLTKVDCRPYKCTSQGRCETQCASDAQCTAGFSCDPAKSQCAIPVMTGGTAPASAENDGGGCGCTVPGRSRPLAPIAFALVIALGAAVTQRRRKQPRSAWRRDSHEG